MLRSPHGIFNSRNTLHVYSRKLMPSDSSFILEGLADRVQATGSIFHDGQTYLE